MIELSGPTPWRGAREFSGRTAHDGGLRRPVARELFQKLARDGRVPLVGVIVVVQGFIESDEPREITAFGLDGRLCLASDLRREVGAGKCTKAPGSAFEKRRDVMFEIIRWYECPFVHATVTTAPVIPNIRAIRFEIYGIMPQAKVKQRRAR